MGRLSGFSHRKVIARLKKCGLHFDRQAPGSHEVWRNQHGDMVSIPRYSGDIPEGTLRQILKDAGISPNQFLSGK